MKLGVICCLTRGYVDMKGYDQIIERNRSLWDLSWAHLYDHIIFHEGNISRDHQAYIVSQCDLPVKFVNISDSFTRDFDHKNDVCKSLPELGHPDWYLGYKRMCRFWFVDFWKYLDNYQYILRIDEDVHVSDTCQDPIQFCQEHKLHYLSAYVMDEEDHVIDGLSRFVKMKQEIIKKMPSTCANVVEIPYYTKPESLNFIKTIDKTGCIFRNRWGDAPLMNVLIQKFTDPQKYTFQWSGFHGYHGSHSRMFNK